MITLTIIFAAICKINALFTIARAALLWKKANAIQKVLITLRILMFTTGVW